MIVLKALLIGIGVGLGVLCMFELMVLVALRTVAKPTTDMARIREMHRFFRRFAITCGYIALHMTLVGGLVGDHKWSYFVFGPLLACGAVFWFISRHARRHPEEYLFVSPTMLFMMPLGLLFGSLVTVLLG